MKNYSWIEEGREEIALGLFGVITNEVKYFAVI
jgi:hypothetical protein